VRMGLTKYRVASAARIHGSDGMERSKVALSERLNKCLVELWSKYGL